MNKNKNDEFQAIAHKYIPGGAHTYSRGDDQYSSNAPKVLTRGKGAYVWDVDGNKFLDYGMALRSVTLGYADDRVNQAAFREIEFGNNLTRPSETEVLAAQDLCSLIPWCEMVKFAKNGSTVTSAATKIARSFTGKKLIARCAEHPFFSYDDWFIGDTLMQAGVPEDISKLTLKFSFNDLNSVKELFRKHPSDIACLILEPATAIEPKIEFLQGLVDIAHQHGTVVIFDEMITGFRWHVQGACKYYGVIPDLITFGKGMGNGFSVAALGGRRDIMQIGGLEHSRERTFLISTTHGAEMCGLGAFREVMKIYKEKDIVGHLWNYGDKFITGMNSIARELGIEKFISFEGTPCSPQYVCRDRDLNISLPLRTLFIQEMINQGVLMPWLAFSFSHTETELNFTLEAARKALAVCRNGLESGVNQFLKGPVIKPVFRQYN